ncbi:hypothetical protein D3C87_1929280 [compost metagenome]
MFGATVLLKDLMVKFTYFFLVGQKPKAWEDGSTVQKLLMLLPTNPKVLMNM